MTDQEMAISALDTSETTENATEETPSTDDSQSEMMSIGDLEPGMELTGEVKSITDFGAFVDVGVGPQGLVHISQLSRRRVEKVSDVVKVGDQVQVWVKKVDKKRGRISLTMVRPPSVSLKDLKPDTVLKGVVTRIEPYGVFVDIGTGRDGMIHISQLADGYISSPEEIVSIGDKIDVKVLNVDRKVRKVDLSTKDFFHVAPPPQSQPAVSEDASASKEEPVPTAMELAFQAALKRVEYQEKPLVPKMIAKRLERLFPARHTDGKINGASRRMPRFVVPDKLYGVPLPHTAIK